MSVDSLSGAVECLKMAEPSLKSARSNVIRRPEADGRLPRIWQPKSGRFTLDSVNYDGRLRSSVCDLHFCACQTDSLQVGAAARMM